MAKTIIVVSSIMVIVAAVFILLINYPNNIVLYHIIDDVIINNKTKNEYNITREYKQFNGYRIINGIQVPTRKLKQSRFDAMDLEKIKQNWYAKPFSVSNCPKNNMINTNFNNNKVINISCWRSDGAGGQLADILEYIAFYRKNQTKYQFYYFPLDWTGHGVYTISKNNYSLLKFDKFVNMRDGERNIHNPNDQCICCHWNILWEKDYQASYLFDHQTLRYLKEKYWRNKHGLNLSFYNSNYFNVAVHIRRGDMIHETRNLPDDYYVVLIKYIFYQQIKINKSRIVSFNIFSQNGFKQESFNQKLKYIQDMYNNKLFKISYQISISLELTFHGMVISDAFIMSKSALSWTAAILSNASYIYYTFYTKPPLNNWIYIEWSYSKFKSFWSKQKCKCKTLNNSHNLAHGVFLCDSWNCSQNSNLIQNVQL